MSKSLDNYIGITESPREIYGKTLSLPDKLIYDYFVLTTNVSADELRTIKRQITDEKTNPRDLKRRLARELVALYHDSQAARMAEEEFERVFVKKELPDEVPEFSITFADSEIGIMNLLTETKLVASKSEARRLIEQGGVSVDGGRIADHNAMVRLDKDVILKVGKRKFVRVHRVS
jgi:tyrosyl-tRNA synthetase